MKAVAWARDTRLKSLVTWQCFVLVHSSLLPQVAFTGEELSFSVTSQTNA